MELNRNSNKRIRGCNKSLRRDGHDTYLVEQGLGEASPVTEAAVDGGASSVSSHGAQS